MAEAGIKFAWIKVTEGTTHVNRGYKDKFKAARDHGIKVGAYHFGRPDTHVGTHDDVTGEVQKFLKGMCQSVGYWQWRFGTGTWTWNKV